MDSSMITKFLANLEWVLLVALMAVLGLFLNQRLMTERAVAGKARVEANYVTQGLALQATQEALERANKAVAERAALAERRRLEVAATKKELDAALKAHPDWSAAPVPDSVWDALGPGRPGANAGAATGAPD